MSKMLLWLGAGDANTPTLHFQDYDSVILVDANFNDLAAKRLNQIANVTVLRKAVTTLDETSLPFYLLNNEEYSSASKPSGLKQIFPNIHVDEVDEVATITPSQLIEEFGISGTDNTLVIDLPCIFLNVLQNLFSQEHLSLFDSVYISAGKIPLYEISASNEEAAQLLGQGHFELQAELSDDPDLLLSHFCFNQNLAAIDSIKSELSVATEQATSLLEIKAHLEAEKQQLAEELQQAKDSNQAQQTKTSEIEAQLQAVESEKEKLAKQLSSEQKSVVQLQAENAQVTSKGVRLASTNKQLEAQLQTAQSEKEKLAKQLTSEHENFCQLQNETKQLKAVKDKLAGQIEQGKSIAQEHQAAIESLENDNMQLSEEIKESRLKLSDTENRLHESEGKYKEVYDWFSSQKQQAETLAKEVESLKRENTALHGKQETINAISQLELKLTSLIEKQGTDNIEIANALGQHVSKCTHEQRNTMASLFELQKLATLEHLPISYSDYSMDASNLSQLSTLVTLNSYDVIIEFGSGLSTVITASTLNEKQNLTDSKTVLSLDNPDHSNIKGGGVTKGLPSHIISFEQESKWLEQTSKLLAMAQLEDYVELCHAPLVNTPYNIDGAGNPLFYDCSEKLLELKRIFSNRKVSILVVVDGPDNKTNGVNLRFAALPMVLDYLSNTEITLFLDDASRLGERQVVQAWQREAERRSLKFYCERLQTPKGIALITIKS